MMQEWTDKHYNFNYTLTEKDIEAGSIKLDPYFVAKQWKIGSKDDSGALFHVLKTVARFGDKNDVEREIKALYAQIKRLAEINNVRLEDVAEDAYKVVVGKTDPLDPWVPDDSGKWIEYDGSGQPIDDYEIVETLLREEREDRYCDLQKIPAWRFSWVNHGSGGDIVAYKVCKD